MSSLPPERSVDAVLDAFIAAWQAGAAPSVEDHLAQADPAAREELADLLAAFLQLAPTIDPTPQRREVLDNDPLVARLAALEDDLWDGMEGTDEAPWGARLRGLREAAGLSVTALGERFAEAFGLTAGDRTRLPQTLAALEAGEVASAGVAARAARALESLLGAPHGVLAVGAAPAFGVPLLRGVLPEDEAGRQQFGELLREVGEALEFSEAGDNAGLVSGRPVPASGDVADRLAAEQPGESLDDLLLGG